MLRKHIRNTGRRCLCAGVGGWITALGCAGWIASASGAAIGRHYVGIAYTKPGGVEIYREEHWVQDESGVETQLVLYRCPSGPPFARKLERGVVGASALDFDFVDGRDGYREGVRGKSDQREVYVQQIAGAPMRTAPLPNVTDAVIDSGFDAYVQSHWSELNGKHDLAIPFLVPSRLEYMNLKLSGATDVDNKGEALRRFRMSLNAWFGFVAPSIDLTYTREDHRLRRFEGIGNIHDSAGKNQVVRIEFTASGRFTSPTPHEISAASALPLATRCTDE
jgi:hypothetical protein